LAPPRPVDADIANSPAYEIWNAAKAGGAGRAAARWPRQQETATAPDPNDVVFAAVAERAPRDVLEAGCGEAIAGDVVEVPFGDGSFDCAAHGDGWSDFASRHRQTSASRP